MSPITAAIAQAALLIAALAICYVPVGNAIAHVFTSPRDLAIERGIYRIIGVDPAKSQSWGAYLRGLIAFSAVGVLTVYALQRLQPWLPYALGLPSVPPPLAFNTAISFVTNTNWQSYSPEQTLGYGVQAAGLAVQNFVSAAVGIVVAIALIRGLAAKGTGIIGSFWVDLTRCLLRILLPAAVVGALLLVGAGVVQNWSGFTTVTTLTGHAQTIPGGPVASQEIIKELGTNGGGFFNANSSHPFENPTPATSWFESFCMLVIPFSLPRTFGRMVSDPRQGLVIVAVMAGLYLVSLTAMTTVEYQGFQAAPQLAGGALEGKEQRFGVFASTLFGTTSTLTSTGAVNSMHDSYTAFGGMMAMVNMMLGEIAPGGVGTGLYAMVILAIIAVFIAGLLVGRTPEYLGKRIGPTEMKLATLSVLVMPTLVLTGTALSFAIPALQDSVTTTSLANPGHHGLSEVLYAFTSASNNNGSAFAGLTADTPWLNTALGIAMALGRFLPIALTVALAGSLANQRPIPATAGTLPTHRPLFAVLLTGVTILVTALTFLPILTLGPIAEGLS